MQSIEASGAQSIMISSGLPESGTTSVALNLAITAIHSGRKVAVVDANFRRPRISDLMGLDPSEPGLGEVLSEEAPLSSVVKTSQDGLVVLPAGSPEYRNHLQWTEKKRIPQVRDGHNPFSWSNKI